MLGGTRGGLVVLAVGAVLAALCVLAVRAVMPETGGLHEDPHPVVAGYAATLSIVYGVLLAFTVVVVWEQLNKTRRLVEDEGNRLADLWRLVGRFDGGAADQLREALRRYGLITRDEWQGELAGNDDCAAAALTAFWRSLIALAPRTRGEEIVHAHTLAQFEEFSRVRSERRLADSERLHPVMWVLLLVGAVATIGSMFFFALEAIWVQGLLSALVGAVLGFTLFIIHDLDDPFDGVWSVGPEPIVRAVGSA